MDIGLCCIDIETRELIFAGAQRSLYLFKGNELSMLTGDKQPIGDFEDLKPFQEEKIQLNKGDMLYLFSDGYGDQFGGLNNKKFKTSVLREVLQRIRSKSTAEQKEELLNEFQSWKGLNEQTDDVCLLGIRF